MLATAYRIETERLVIRCYQPQDAALLKAAIDESLDHLRPWMPWAVHEPESVKAKLGRMRKYRGSLTLVKTTFSEFLVETKHVRSVQRGCTIV